MMRIASIMNPPSSSPNSPISAFKLLNNPPSPSPNSPISAFKLLNNPPSPSPNSPISAFKPAPFRLNFFRNFRDNTGTAKALSLATLEEHQQHHFMRSCPAVLRLKAEIGSWDVESQAPVGLIAFGLAYLKSEVVMDAMTSRMRQRQPLDSTVVKYLLELFNVDATEINDTLVRASDNKLKRNVDEGNNLPELSLESFIACFQDAKAEYEFEGEFHNRAKANIHLRNASTRGVYGGIFGADVAVKTQEKQRNEEREVHERWLGKGELLCMWFQQLIDEGCVMMCSDHVTQTLLDSFEKDDPLGHIEKQLLPMFGGEDSFFGESRQYHVDALRSQGTGGESNTKIVPGNYQFQNTFRTMYFALYDTEPVVTATSKLHFLSQLKDKYADLERKSNLGGDRRELENVRALASMMGIGSMELACRVCLNTQLDPPKRKRRKLNSQ